MSYHQDDFRHPSSTRNQDTLSQPQKRNSAEPNTQTPERKMKFDPIIQNTSPLRFKQSSLTSTLQTKIFLSFFRSCLRHRSQTVENLFVETTHRINYSVTVTRTSRTLKTERSSILPTSALEGSHSTVPDREANRRFQTSSLGSRFAA